MAHETNTYLFSVQISEIKTLIKPPYGMSSQAGVKSNKLLTNPLLFLFSLSNKIWAKFKLEWLAIRT